MRTSENYVKGGQFPMPQIPWYSLLFLFYLLFVNLFAVVITVLDKHRSRCGKWRIKEKTLLLTALFGGSLGMYICMLIVRHKTKKSKFMLGLPLIMLLQTVFILSIWWAVAR